MYFLSKFVLILINMRLSYFVYYVRWSVIIVIKKLNKAEPGQWSIAQSANRLCLPGLNKKDENLIEFELHNCMPIPTSDVAYADILEFKHRRKDEYTAFKELIGELYLEIINSNDIPRAKTHCLNKLEKAINDIDKVSSESFTKRLFKSFSINLNPANLLAHGLAGVGVATLFNMPISLGAAAGSVLGSFNFNLATHSVPDVMHQNQKGLAYLLQAHKEFERKIGRNELCPCGSGKKYKKCCLK